VNPERAQRQRAEMVRNQLRGRGISDERVLAAMASVPRELFLPADLTEDAYRDGALPIAAGQTISQPYIVALMTAMLAPRPGARVLEIGTGSGYQAAVLAAIGCDVLSIERHADLAEQARIRLALPELASLVSNRIRIEVGDGSAGWPAEAPFDGILVTAAAPRVPDSLRRQLADGGRLAIPIGPLRGQNLIQVIRRGEGFEERAFGGCLFVPLVGVEGYGEDAATARSRWPWRFWG
jgi:protein-L-isoaspartate(D-aspartate) O-methyltransferase